MVRTEKSRQAGSSTRLAESRVSKPNSNIRFFLIRHAIKQKEIGDVPITPAGMEQAKLTAQYLSRSPWSIDAVISSPLRRAVETAHYIAAEVKVPLIRDNRLRERANWGDLPEQTFQEFVEMWEKCTREPDYIPPVGDSARQASERMSSLLLELVNTYPPGSQVVIVTHGGLITDFLVNTFSEAVLNQFHPSFIAEQSNLVSECAITKLNYDGESFVIEDFASVDHLSAPRREA
ncbi:probable phosphoglycerate mutase [Paenibacillus sp. UNCCL117]|uniref:histidine phosphatase family protein n=1 Tax=unclassified Paenibacillus TaxID=185978 RepID=UPI000886008C|nr:MULTISPECIES: histidine phosphatase family protein [unclassified Paenibacillus]SDE44188.1 probable phosphoglycerate mutase [Paenibacillus sp. cl123]SFW46194.1 probable phosphoglycerate mutase [Paenibacillus sp. UNCCL117]